MISELAFVLNPALLGDTIRLLGEYFNPDTLYSVIGFQYDDEGEYMVVFPLLQDSYSYTDSMYLPIDKLGSEFTIIEKGPKDWRSFFAFMVEDDVYTFVIKKGGTKYYPNGTKGVLFCVGKRIVALFQVENDRYSVFSQRRVIKLNNEGETVLISNIDGTDNEVEIEIIDSYVNNFSEIKKFKNAVASIPNGSYVSYTDPDSHLVGRLYLENADIDKFYLLGTDADGNFNSHIVYSGISADADGLTIIYDKTIPTKTKDEVRAENGLTSVKAGDVILSGTGDEGIVYQAFQHSDEDTFTKEFLVVWKTKNEIYFSNNKNTTNLGYKIVRHVDNVYNLKSALNIFCGVDVGSVFTLGEDLSRSMPAGTVVKVAWISKQYGYCTIKLQYISDNTIKAAETAAGPSLVLVTNVSKEAFDKQIINKVDFKQLYNDSAYNSNPIFDFSFLLIWKDTDIPTNIVKEYVEKNKSVPSDKPFVFPNQMTFTKEFFDFNFKVFLAMNRISIDVVDELSIGNRTFEHLCFELAQYQLDKIKNAIVSDSTSAVDRGSRIKVTYCNDKSVNVGEEYIIKKTSVRHIEYAQNPQVVMQGVSVKDAKVVVFPTEIKFEIMNEEKADA